MLIGTYRHAIDEKKRMRVPPKFKAELGANFIITKGTSKNLFVFSIILLYNRIIIIKNMNL